MSDRMNPIPFSRLMEWCIAEFYQSQSLFGVANPYAYPPSSTKLACFQCPLEAPFGPAAGPHTQLAQNLIAAYGAGARYFELKTVQKMDGAELAACISKPCINAADEGYNCEWSTELTVPQAYEEYVKAWFAIKLLAKEFSLGQPDAYLFNMSVGYDLEGIQTEKIDTFIEQMKDASKTAIWKTCMDWAFSNLERFHKVDTAYINQISPCISNSITLSTLHGCPPQEIERISTYLLSVKRLHTYIKCNPTLLGYPYARETLDTLGFDYVSFDDHHFREDLQLQDAIPIFRRLQALAKTQGLTFGIKLTNTFPVDTLAGELPASEMYMSGRPLYPLSLAAAQKLSSVFEGKLPISYSGGADIHNIRQLLQAGIWPVTLATTLLKPGGYQRLSQIAHEISGIVPPFAINQSLLDQAVTDASKDAYYRKPVKPLPKRKIQQYVPLMDCFTAPCRSGCPIGQDIPAYVHLAGEQKYLEALRVIIRRNPLPFTTGTICTHHCMDKCTRGFYEESIHIRSAKLEAAQAAYSQLLDELRPTEMAADKKAAVIGGGPAGISAAYFLARAGVPVTVFEKREALGGVVRYIIPSFRISSEAIEKDAALAKALGAKFVCGTEITSLQALKKAGFTHILVASGAWSPTALHLEKGRALDAFLFLDSLKRDPSTVQLGREVVVIGGGNTAMDTARAAKRVPGVAHVRIVYRRDKRNMPADEEELCLALAEGVEFSPLCAPISHEQGLLLCHKMTLGEPDETGRRSPVDTGVAVQLPADTVIAAIGGQVGCDFFEANGIKVNQRGHAVVSPHTLQSEAPGVYVIGDANRGPATVVEAIADAAKAVSAIIEQSDIPYSNEPACSHTQDVMRKKGILYTEQPYPCTEAERCLECGAVCECCADVCPNRANAAIRVEGKQMRQILHIDGMCNECGNCATFCPYDSAPYRDKFTLFWDEEGFNSSQNDGFLLLDAEKQMYRVRLNGTLSEIVPDNAAASLPPDLSDFISAVYQSYPHLFVSHRR